MLVGFDENNGSAVFARYSGQPPGGRSIVRAAQVNTLDPIEVPKR